MEAYIEVALIHHLFLLSLIFKIVRIMMLKRIKQQAIITYLSLSMLVACCFSKDALMIWLVFEISACLRLFKDCFKGYFLMWGIRISVYLIIYLVSDVSFHQGIIFFSLDYKIGCLLLIEIILYFYLKTNQGYQLVLKQFVYPITFHLSKPLTLNAYLDSGNFASLQQIPIVIVDEKYQVKFKELKKCPYYYKSIDHQALIDLSLCKISFNDEISNVYVCFKALHLKHNCEVLLNIKMIGRS